MASAGARARRTVTHRAQADPRRREVVSGERWLSQCLNDCRVTRSSAEFDPVRDTATTGKPAGSGVEWQTHFVDVTPDGFIFDGTTYRSLSAIAKRITGAHWSGPRFFGL